MKFKLFALLLFSTFCLQSTAQWSLQPGIGVSIPITGYATVVKSGILYQFDVRRQLKNPKWELGLLLGWGRMHHDKSETDTFYTARLDQVPMIINAVYSFRHKKITPYAGFGLGVSLYNFSYERSLTVGETVTNVSFSIMPRLGISMQADEKIAPFLEVNCPLVMDGPPVGLSKGEKVTGYVGIALGIKYDL